MVVESSTQQWLGQCLRKKRYHSFGLVEQVKDKVYNERGVRLREYHCPHCMGYHFTKQILSGDRKYG